MNRSRHFATLLALGLSGAALAQTPPVTLPAGPPPDPFGDATVTRAESLAKAGTMFDAIDKNHDGVVNEAEEDAAVKVAGQGGRMVAGALHRADANGDGKLTRQEFLAGQGERFDRQDADHDGKLTRAERDAAREQMRQRMQSRMAGQRGKGFGQPTPPPSQADGFGPPAIRDESN